MFVYASVSIGNFLAMTSLAILLSSLYRRYVSQVRIAGTYRGDLSGRGFGNRFAADLVVYTVIWDYIQ